MESRLKFIEDKEFDVDDFFIDAMLEIEMPIALKIAMFLNENKIRVKTNNLVSYVLGGLIIYNNEPITFAVEIIKADSEYMTFTDISLITIDEYLDLMNLNLYIKSNERTKSKSIKSNC